MKKRLVLGAVLSLLALLVGGCGGEDIVSSAPEAAVSSASPEWSATETTTAESTSASSTTCRYPLTSQTTTTTDRGSVTVSRTYPTAPFTVGAAVRVPDETFTEDFRGQVITTKAQLDALALDEEYGTDEYTESYFKDKSLVVLEFRLTSGSIQLRVDTLGVKGDTMTVFYTTLRPTPFTNDMAYRRILLEVDRNMVEDVNTVVGYEDQICSHVSNPTVF